MSTVAPSIFYGDPQFVVEQAELDDLGCGLCTKHGFILTKAICLEPKNEKQKGVPHIGHRCRWFDEGGCDV